MKELHTQFPKDELTATQAHQRQSCALALFDDLVELDTRARQSALNDIRTTDAALFEEISALLQADDKPWLELEMSPLEHLAKAGGSAGGKSGYADVNEALRLQRALRAIRQSMGPRMG